MGTCIDLGKSNKCSGCTACLNICSKQAISMQRDSKGFLYPVIDRSKCIECGLCLKACTWLDKINGIEESTNFYAAKRIDFKKRMQSQSGGAFSVFAEYILHNKGIVYGVIFKEGKALYIRITKLKQLKELKGSKYMQASVGDVFPLVADDLKSKKKVLFAGTACHVDGLNRFLRLRNVDRSNLITIDIICHGVVSPMFFEKYIEYIEGLKGKKVKWFNFRDKSFGWHGHITTYKMGNNVYKSKDYVRIFYSSYVLRDTCYECQYSNLNRVSDITIGDCWGIGDHYPEFDDNKGCSLIIPNSESGKELFKQTKSQFEFIEISKEEALQPNLSHPTERPENYDKFWFDYQKYGFEYAICKYCNVDPLNDSLVLQKHQIIKRFVGKMKRMLGIR